MFDIHTGLFVAFNLGFMCVPSFPSSAPHMCASRGEDIKSKSAGSRSGTTTYTKKTKEKENENMQKLSV